MDSNLDEFSRVYSSSFSQDLNSPLLRRMCVIMDQNASTQPILGAQNLEIASISIFDAKNSLERDVLVFCK
jgi:hypothetical protein